MKEKTINANGGLSLGCAVPIICTGASLGYNHNSPHILIVDFPDMFIKPGLEEIKSLISLLAVLLWYRSTVLPVLKVTHNPLFYTRGTMGTFTISFSVRDSHMAAFQIFLGTPLETRRRNGSHQSR